MLDSVFQLLFTYRPVVFQQGEFRLVPSTGSYVAAIVVGLAIAVTVLTYRAARSRTPGARHRIVLVSLRMAILGLMLFAGAIVTETVFAWPGVGRLTYEAVIYRDFPLLQAVIILKAILILSINLFVDILYAYVDPRIRLA